MGPHDQGIELRVAGDESCDAMVHVYPIDPHRRRRQPGILDVVRRYGEELAVSGLSARTPAQRTQAGAGLLVVDRRPTDQDAR
jgi:hypothetical protein